MPGDLTIGKKEGLSLWQENYVNLRQDLRDSLWLLDQVSTLFSLIESFLAKVEFPMLLFGRDFCFADTYKNRSELMKSIGQDLQKLLDAISDQKRLPNLDEFIVLLGQATEGFKKEDEFFGEENGLFTRAWTVLCQKYGLIFYN